MKTGMPHPSGQAAVDAERSLRRIMRTVRLVFFLVAVGLGVLAWGEDVITRQGERTVYTVDCSGGIWLNGQCSGKLLASERIKFKASKARGEVVFWKLGQAKKEERLAPCSVNDGRNWSCFDEIDAPKTITLELSHGNAQPDPLGRTLPCHTIPKWKWWLLRSGFASH
jgi:hypothetical protein